MSSSIRSTAAAVLAAVVALAGGPATQAATTEVFVPTTLDYPGATSTQARGINNPGDIVGSFVCAAACVNPLTGEVTPAGAHGFFLSDGIYTRLDVPGASLTLARGISEQGIVVGQYTTAGVQHAFLYSEGTYIYPIDVPAELFDNPSSPRRHTLGVGISPQGDLVGCFHEGTASMTTMHGWLWRNGRFTALMTPHYAGDTTSRDPDTMNNAISATGDIVGFYFSSGISYVANSDGIVNTFTYDGGFFTLAWDINGRGDIVGVRGDNPAETLGFALNPRGFLRTRHGEYRTLEVQGASATQVFGINALREIVGQYTAAGRTHGFVYRLSR